MPDRTDERFNDGIAKERSGRRYLESMEYWTEPAGMGAHGKALSRKLSRTRSLARWWPDLYAWPRNPAGALILVDVKSKLRQAWRHDLVIEIAPLALAISGAYGLPVYFMEGKQWAAAREVWTRLEPRPNPHCCPEHFEQLMHLLPGRTSVALGLVEGLPEKCAEYVARGAAGSGTPFVVASPLCLHPIPNAWEFAQ